jgi:murein DD-endopeptidase MepM/ murein hydrolase activator NlpD
LGPLKRFLSPFAVAFGLVLVASTAASPAGAESSSTSIEIDDEGDVFEPEVEAETASDQVPDIKLTNKPAKKRTARAAAAARAARIATPVASQPGALPVAEVAPMRTDFNLTPLAASPVPGVESSGFGWRDDPINNRRKFHKGTDFRAPRGTPVFAAGGGQVIFAGRMGGYGNVVFIDHGDGVITRYGHLRRIGTKREARVVAGAQIGEVGSTGRATGPHLHFEVRLDGRAVNPSVAISLGALQRLDPVAARSAMAALAPEVQQASVDPHKKAGKRPDRRGRAKRQKALW